MRAVRLCFFRMLAAMRRDKMLFAACLAPVFIGFLFRFAIPLLETVLTGWFHKSEILSPYYALFDLFFAMLTPAMFCFASAMVSLEEADEKTMAYLFVTPLGREGYLAARFCIPSAAAFLITVLLMPFFRLSSLSGLTAEITDFHGIDSHAAGLIGGLFAGDRFIVILLAAGGALQGVILSLLIVILSSNKLEGMAVAKLSTLIMFGAVVPFFIKGNVQYVLCLLPSFWIGKAVYGDRMLYMLPAFALSAVWIGFLVKRYTS